MIEPAHKEIARLLRFIAKGAAEIVETQNCDKLVLESGAYGTISATRNVVKFALSQGLGVLQQRQGLDQRCGTYLASPSRMHERPLRLAASERSDNCHCR